MRKVIGASAALGCAVLFTISCSKAEEKADTTAKGPDTTQPAAKQPAKPAATKPDKAPAGDQAAASTMTNDAKNCPSAITGAKTQIARKDDSLVITIQGNIQGAINLIRTRSKQLSQIDTSAVSKPTHTGKGTGGGALGLCPILMPGTTMKVEEIDAGVKVILTPKEGTKLDVVKQDADKRLADLLRMFRAKKTGGERGHGSGQGMGRGGGHGEGGGTGQATHKGDDGKQAAAGKGKDKDKDKDKDKKKKQQKKPNPDEGSGW